MLADVPTDLVVKQPGCTHARSTNPTASTEPRYLRVQEFSRINYTQETAEPLGVSPPEAVDLLLIKGVPGSPVVGSRAMVAVADVPLKDHGQGVMDLIASDAVIDEAYAWLCDRRRDYSPHDDVWTLRERWADVKPRLQRSLLRGEYRCDVTRRAHTAEGVIEIWSAADALVLKATALVLQKELAPVLSPSCFHLAGHGGLKGAVRAVDAARRDQTFVFRTDVHGYYASLDHGILYRQVREHVTDRRVLKLVWSYLRHMVCDGGEYEAVNRESVSAVPSRR